MRRVLIIRFSSFGDIIQALAASKFLQDSFKDKIVIDWIVRSDYTSIISLIPFSHNIISYERKSGILGLAAIAKKIALNDYDLIYDAHLNLRSLILIKLFYNIYYFTNFIYTFLCFKKIRRMPLRIYRSKERWKRFLLFKLHQNLFPKPFKGALSYILPLERYCKREGVFNPYPHFKFNQNIIFQEISSIDLSLNSEINFKLTTKIIILAPAAAWEMKRWPTHYFTKLIQLFDLALSEDKSGLKKRSINLSNNIKWKFYIIGGPKDDFCDEISKTDIINFNQIEIFNFAGKISLEASIFLISLSEYIISADTGHLHVADLLGKKGAALIGPTAFGYPSGKSLTVVESLEHLNCRPCTKDGRGKCSQKIYKKCLFDIKPDRILEIMLKDLSS